MGGWRLDSKTHPVVKVEISPDLFLQLDFFLEFSIQEVLVFFQRIMVHWKMAEYLKCDVTIGDTHTHFFH